MEIDAIGTFNMSRAAFSALAKSGDGRVINISATLHYGATWYQVRCSPACPEPVLQRKPASRNQLAHSGRGQHSGCMPDVQVHASAAKAAIDSITRTLALEWGQRGIKVNGIAPGPIRGTAGMSKLAPGASEEAMEAEMNKTIPLGRMGERADIALASVFLCSSGASWVTGALMMYARACATAAGRRLAGM